MYRTLIIDESRIFRTALREALRPHPAVEVVAAEFSVERGLARVTKGGVDVVLADLALPGTPTTDFLRQWKELSSPRPLVLVMSASLDARAPAVFDAMALGASGFLVKPKGPVGELATALGAMLTRLHRSRGDVAPRRAGAKPAARSQVGELVAIVSSTGGPDALRVLLAGLKGGVGAPIAIVQHLPAGFSASLSANLSKHSGFRAVEAEHGMVLKPNLIVMAPGDQHLEIDRSGEELVCRLVEGPKENGCRPAGDRMLRTAALATQGRMTAVCLTGMGNDGAAGMQQVHALGGRVIVQDEASSVVWGMPASVLEAGVPALVLPLGRIASSLLRKSKTAA